MSGMKADRYHSHRHIGEYDTKREREYERLRVLAAPQRVTTGSMQGMPTSEWFSLLAARPLSERKA